MNQCFWRLYDAFNNLKQCILDSITKNVLFTGMLDLKLELDTIPLKKI